jgi:3-oxoadipate enol-lactonase
MIRESHLEHDGRRLRFLESGAGWPLVLIHSFPLSADQWRPQLDAPPPGWRMICPDVRGFGPSATHPTAQMSMDLMARDVLALMDHLEIDRAMIGGLSMGGYVTFALLRIAPERFSGMILSNTRATPDSLDGKAGRDRMSKIVRTGGPAAVADDMIPKLLGETTHAARPQVEALVRRLIVSNSAEGIDGGLQAMKNREDATPLLDPFTGPVLVISGEEDTLIPAEESDAMAGRFQRVHALTLTAAGHLSNLEVPSDFSEVLHNFLHATI